ncbi:MAG: tRNA (adenosine(37)-N6)-threonylcarbamoyltransferase complex dimerization subunit type 1 TsaB [Acidimicrobiales bacterium]
MIVLGIETATTDVGAALVDEDRVLSALSAGAGRRHVETLHPMVAEACRLAGIDLKEIGAVAVDVGPGLFTGIRVGLAAAQGFALALGVPVAGVTSLEALSAALRPASLARAGVAAVVDLRRGEVAFSYCRPGAAAPGAPTRAGPDEAARHLAALAAEDSCVLVCCGDGARSFRAELEDAAAAAGVELVFASAGLAAPAAPVVAAEGLLKVLSGDVAGPGGPEPMYLREPDARINWSPLHGGP